MRIGLVGSESSHAEDFLRLLNGLERYPGHRIVAIRGEAMETARALGERFGVGSFPETADDLASSVDAALIVTRHGGDHLKHARTFLTGGLPVFIDKPLACSTADAESILRLARESGAPVLSASALRWQPDLDAFARKTAALGGASGLTVTGTYFPESSHGGAFFYGIHAVEIALELTGATISDCSVDRGNDEAIIRFRAGGTRVEVRLVPPAGDEVSFAAEAICAGGTVANPIGLGEEYMAPVLDRFFEMVRTGRPPLTEAEMLTPVQLLSLI